MSVLVISFLISLLACLLLLRYNHLHSVYSADADLAGVQKFHTRPIPRIGGVAIFIGLVLSLVMRFFQNSEVGFFCGILVFCSLPAFLSGLSEDLTKRVGVKFRLVATIFSAVLAGYFLGGWLTTVQILGFDNLMLTYPLVAITVTCFAVAGVSNAFNIIDGYNGLSSMVAIFILSGIAYVAFQVGDSVIMIAALAMIGALFGFVFWNYPRGLIFLGDGGAYLIGFWIAELSVLLTARHAEVSKWFPLLLCMYPIFETLFTIYRRVILKRVHPGMADASHLHQLIYKRVVRWSVGTDQEFLRVQRNSLTSPYLWMLSLLAILPAVLFWRYHEALKFFAMIFAISYLWLYWAIVRYQVPEYLIISNE
jgi:UDP-N-acetylmuramyl pentapeptide phosphotransferase/UDP-N-acetylglucosamine-1-phosphate transferase